MIIVIIQNTCNYVYLKKYSQTVYIVQFLDIRSHLIGRRNLMTSLLTDVCVILSLLVTHTQTYNWVTKQQLEKKLTRETVNNSCTSSVFTTILTLAREMWTQHSEKFPLYNSRSFFPTVCLVVVRAEVFYYQNESFTF